MDKNELNEIKKYNILEELKYIEECVSLLNNMITKSKYLDNDTKQNILILRKLTNDIYNKEMDKELQRQKDDGKEFLSDVDIDDLFKKIGI